MRLALNTGVGWIQPNSYDYRSGTKHTLLLAAARLFRETPIKVSEQNSNHREDRGHRGLPRLASPGDSLRLNLL